MNKFDFENEYHKSVLFNEVIDVLLEGEIKDAWFLDGTLGDGGYTLEILKKGGRVVGIDVDPNALKRSKDRLTSEGIDSSRYILLQGNFRDLKNLIHTQTELQEIRFKGAILDLGVSSLQLGNPERGFSFGTEGPLDMRMDPTLSVQALDLVNALNKGELNELFTKLGEESLGKQIADSIVSARGVTGIKTTKDLASVVEKVYRRFGMGGGKIHPATKVFQALRIAVNDELNVLKEGLPDIVDLMEKDGRLAVISFHSLEDRIVKNTFKEWEEQGLGVALTKKPIEATEKEIEENARSRSAKMRVFRKI